MGKIYQVCGIFFPTCPSQRTEMSAHSHINSNQDNLHLSSVLVMSTCINLLWQYTASCLPAGFRKKMLRATAIKEGGRQWAMSRSHLLQKPKHFCAVVSPSCFQQSQCPRKVLTLEFSFTWWGSSVTGMLRLFLFLKTAAVRSAAMESPGILIRTTVLDESVPGLPWPLFRIKQHVQISQHGTRTLCAFM